MHARMGEKAARHGKHILMEKPFVLDISQGKRLVRLCRLRNVKLGVVHPNRTKAIVLALRNAVKQGWFGRLTHACAAVRWSRSPEYFNSASWRGTKDLDGGILYNQAIHSVDLLNWLLGPAGSVFAYGATRHHAIECEDVCVCVLRFENGALGTIEAAITLYPENLEESLAVFGTDGTAVLGGRTLSKILEWKFSCLTDEDAEKQIGLLNGIQDKSGHKEIIENFVDSIEQNREPLVSGDEAMKTLYLINAIYESIKSNQPVKLTSNWNG